MSRTLSRLKKEGRLSFTTPQRKRASFRIERRISQFFSSCGRKHGAPLALRRGPQGLVRVSVGKSGLHASCEGPLGIAFQLVLRPRYSSGVEDGNSWCPSSADMDLRVPMEYPQGSQTSSRVETCKSAFLSRCHRAVTPPIVF